MNEKLSPKQLEILQRKPLILDAACHIIRSQGYSRLNMNNIAQALGCARGTIYSDYQNKEAILAELVIRNLQRMVNLFDRALEYPGRTREKMLAIMVAYELYIKLYPEDFKDFQILKNVSIREKLCAEQLSEISRLENHGIACSSSVVVEALALGELKLREISPEQLVFGCWSMAFGSASLQFSDIPLEELGIHSPLQTAHIHARHMFDGYNWQPLSSDWDYAASKHDILSSIFAAELAQLTSTGVSI